jgi:hypothetical protein
LSSVSVGGAGMASKVSEGVGEFTEQADPL